MGVVWCGMCGSRRARDACPYGGRRVIEFGGGLSGIVP